MRKWRFICLLLIMINICTILIILIKDKRASQELQNSQDMYIKLEPHSIEENNRICPQGLYQFAYKYSGNTSLDYFQEALYTFVNQMSLIDSELIQMDESQIKEYYNNNKEIIEKNTTIFNSENFIHFIKFSEKYQKYGKYENIKLLNETYDEEGNYTNINMIIILSDVEQLKFKVFIGNSGEQEEEIRFIPIVEE